MRKNRLRLLCATLVAMLAIVLCACGGTKPEDGIVFRNGSDEEVAGFYISSTSNDNWGEHCNKSTVKAGGETVISGDVLVDGGGVVYDVAAYNGVSMVYEFYGITLDKGYTIELSANGIGSMPTLTVTDASGSSVTYEGSAVPHVG